MSMNEADTRYHLLDPVLRDKGYVNRDHVTLETVRTSPAVAPCGPKGRRRKGPSRTGYLLRVKVGDAPKPTPVAVVEAKKAEDPLKGMQQARGYADTLRFDVKYVFSTNGHRQGEYDRFNELITDPAQFCDFPSHPGLTARYCKDTGIDLTKPESAMLFQAGSAAWSQSRYDQDAAIRAMFEKNLLDRQAGKPPRALLTLATATGKTIIATNLLWRLSQAGQLPKPALFRCNHDELREQAYTIEESGKASTEDQEITAKNRQYFGEPMYEYTLIQAQEDGYPAACEIVKRKASIDSATLTKKEIFAAGARDIQCAAGSRRASGAERMTAIAE